MTKEQETAADTPVLVQQSSLICRPHKVNVLVLPQRTLAGC